MNDRSGEFGIPARSIAATSAFAPFRWPAFRMIWVANLVSALGSMIQSIAAAWLMTDLTDSHLLVALVQASIVIPVLFIGVFAGVLADNYDRRKVMLGANLGMAAVSAVLAALAWLEVVAPWSLLLMTLLIGCGFALNGPAWQASVRLQVPHEDLPQAISLNSIAFNMARSVGPAIGGVLLSLSGPKLAFTVNALSYALMIAVLLRWRPRATGRRDKHAVFPAIGAALRFCANSSPIRRVLARGFAFGLGATAYQALIPLVVREQVGGNETDFGLVLGAFGVGSVLTALWIGPARRRLGPVAGRPRLVRQRPAGDGGQPFRRRRAGRGADQPQRLDAVAQPRGDPRPLPGDLPGAGLRRLRRRLMGLGHGLRCRRTPARAARRRAVAARGAHRAARACADAAHR